VQLAEAMTVRLAAQWRQSTVTAVETGRRPLKFDEAIALATELGLTLDWLAGQAPATEDGLRRWARESDARFDRATAALAEARSTLEHVQTTLAEERDSLVKPWEV
jgi:hypothetical protein